MLSWQKCLVGCKAEMSYNVEQTLNRLANQINHPYPAAWFTANRPAVAEFVNEILAAIRRGVKHILIKAPVKSGKRVIVECLSVLFPGYRVKYITSLNRIDVKNQKEELETYGISTLLTKDDAAVTGAIQEISRNIDDGHRVMLCYDECDYGSGNRQKLARLYQAFINEPDAVKLYFSATAHETEASTLSGRDDFQVMPYVPPPEYCGAGYFYQNNLVFEPNPFFEMELGDVVVSEHGKQVIRDSITPERHIGVVRTTRGIPTALFKNTQVRRELERQLHAINPDGRPWTITPVDQKDSHDWENPITRRGFVMDTESNHLIVIMQTCTRGTDLKGWHAKLAFWHDQRDCEKVNLNTMIQAVLRPCHYSTDYAGVPQRVRLYVDPRVVKVAWDDDIEDYINHSGKSPTRTRTSPVRGNAVGWGVPFKVTLPNELLTSAEISSQICDATRAVLTPAILNLLTAEERIKLQGRTLKHKRCYNPGVVGGIFTVNRAFNASNISCPGGGMTDEIQEIRNNHFWIDIAMDDLNGIPRGTAFITYGDPQARRNGVIHATTASMYESRR